MYDYNARYYDPYLNRFISPDPIVPDPISSSSFNRYAYVNNNPLNYVDPSGYFSETAIKNYLEANNENSDEILKQWKNDKDWWEMITTAEAGDFLFGGAYSSFFFYQFQGSGFDELTGISIMPSNLPDHFTQHLSLEDIQRGYLDGYAAHRRQFVSVEWVGMLRHPEGGTPSFYARYPMKQTSTRPLATHLATTVEWVGAAVSSVKLGETIGKNVLKLIVAESIHNAGFALTMPSLADGLDREPGDVNVTIGPAYFNFQRYGNGWTLEHYKWARSANSYYEPY